MPTSISTPPYSNPTEENPKSSNNPDSNANAISVSPPTTGKPVFTLSASSPSSHSDSNSMDKPPNASPYAPSRLSQPALTLNDDYDYNGEEGEGEDSEIESGDDYAPTSNTIYPSSYPTSYSSSEKQQHSSTTNGVSVDSPSRPPTPGLRPPSLYTTLLPHWRSTIRQYLLLRVERESIIIARMQRAVRTPWLDAYFVYTSSLGTHSFFMTVLPALFFFGWDDLGRGLLIVLALGVYCSSVVKDLICSPRPFAPPVTRLTIGNHHLEYGFPSTHSTNSVSIALFFFSHVHTLASSSAISTTTARTLYTVLLFYTFSIVYGRLYTAMHSFTDCVMGVAMGAGIWYVFDGHFGLGVGGWVEGLIGGGAGASGAWTGAGWIVPLTLIPWGIFAVNQHPQPVDDCPCFEDAIAFVSVMLGALVGKWHAGYFGWDLGHWQAGLGMGQEGQGQVYMPGSKGTWDPTEGMWVRTWRDVGVWWGVAGVKMVVGILVIFTWRLLAKSALHLVLPPIYRVLAKGFRLPNRRFYTPATDYKSVPSEFSGHHALRPIPSVIDLPGTGGVGVEVGGIGAGEHDYGYGVEVSGSRKDRLGVSRVIKMRGGISSGHGKHEVGPGNYNASGGGSVTWVDGDRVGNEQGKDGELVKHYDADVLTKVIVYSGIAVLACQVLPVLFEILGWGVKSWPMN